MFGMSGRRADFRQRLRPRMERARIAALAAAEAAGSVASSGPSRWPPGLAEEAGRVRRPRAARPPVCRSAFAGFRFPPEVITVAVRWYLRYGLSYRDLEELLVERGVEVDHVTVYRWVQRFTSLFADAARPLRHATGGPVVRRRALRQSGRPVAVLVPGGRPAWAGHRRAAV
jgi:hypothetical protein